jgi:hypothetical protein
LNTAKIFLNQQMKQAKVLFYLEDLWFLKVGSCKLSNIVIKQIFDHEADEEVLQIDLFDFTRYNFRKAFSSLFFKKSFIFISG